LLAAVSILEQKCGGAGVRVVGSYLPGFIRPRALLWRNIRRSVGLRVEVDGLLLFSPWTGILSCRYRTLCIVLGLALGLLADVEPCLSIPCLTGRSLAFSCWSRRQSRALTHRAGV